MSCKHLRQQTQLRFTVKKEFVATYGIVATCAASGFAAKTLNVAQHPSIFSTQNTDDLVSPATSSLLVGISNGVLLLPQV